VEAFYEHGHKHFKTDVTAHLFSGGKYRWSLDLHGLPMYTQLGAAEPSLNQLSPTPQFESQRKGSNGEVEGLQLKKAAAAREIPSPHASILQKAGIKSS